METNSEAGAACPADWRRPGYHWHCDRPAGHRGRHRMRPVPLADELTDDAAGGGRRRGAAAAVAWAWARDRTLRPLRQRAHPSFHP
jgi:hypothetical protein